jgi:ribose/xylose/arabinose/galactoside ABC-type transport system permease subunit
MTAVSEVESPAGPKGWWGTLRRHQSIVGPWVILLLLVVVSTLISPDFLSTTNLVNILRQAAPLMIVALGQTLVILVGGIDVSVGAVIAMTTVIGGSLMRDSNA